MEKSNNSDVIPAKKSPKFLLAIPPELRHEIEKRAAAKDRKLTAEINRRLQESVDRESSLPPSGMADGGRDAVGGALLAQTGPADYTTTVETTATERAMLRLFRSWPPEKQLAFLSLFK